MTTSVAMCTYNGEKYLRQQLDSISKQTVKIGEIVICDDGSTDSTLDIIREYSIKGVLPVRSFRNAKNLGYTANFEKALRLCSGDVVFLADQDDIWVPNKVEKTIGYFEKNEDVDFVFTDAMLINQHGLSTYDVTLFDVVGMDDRNKKFFNEGRYYDVLATSGRVTGATAAVRASFLPYCIPFPKLMKKVHDEMIAVTAAIHNRIGFIDECLIKYRLHQQQSIGLVQLFRHPAKKWELAEGIHMWHEFLTDITNENISLQMRIAYERFEKMMSPKNIFKLLIFYLSGKYNIYDNPMNVFLCDIKGSFERYYFNSIKRRE